MFFVLILLKSSWQNKGMNFCFSHNSYSLIMLSSLRWLFLPNSKLCMFNQVGDEVCRCAIRHDGTGYPIGTKGLKVELCNELLTGYSIWYQVGPHCNGREESHQYVSWSNPAHDQVINYIQIWAYCSNIITQKCQYLIWMACCSINCNVFFVCM